METKDGDTVVVVYFDDIDTTKLQLEFKAIRTHNVAELKPAPVMIYDYYDNCKFKDLTAIRWKNNFLLSLPARRASTFYNAPQVSLSDISASED